MISRANEASLEKFYDLLIDRLPKTFDGRSWPQVCGVLRSAMSGNNYYFVNSENAIGLAQLVQKGFRQFPDLEEVFMIARNMPRDLEELKALYKGAILWGKSRGARTFDIAYDSDLSQENFTELAKELNAGIKIEKIPYIEIL